LLSPEPAEPESNGLPCFGIHFSRHSGKLQLRNFPEWRDLVEPKFVAIRQRLLRK